MTMTVPRILSRHPRLWTALLVAVIGVADYASGIDITFVELMYLVPIGFATWFASRAAGVVSALAAAAIIVAINVGGDSAAHVPWFNGLGALGIFIVFVWLLSVLRAHVDREAARLRGALEQLRHAERLNVLGVLAAGVAHELGTPLNVISGAAEMLDDDDPPPEKRRELSRVIFAQTERITGIIQNLLDFGRRGRPAKKTAELDAAVSSAVTMLASTARKRGAAIALTAHAGEPQVRGTRQEIEQVVSNLILNGIQAMPHGGRIVVETRREDRVDEDGASHAYGTITVADEGIGIAPENMAHIFDPFFTTKDVGEGTGLGLSVTYGIVSDLGGSIDVASRLGEGTRFTVRLPIAR